MVQTIYRHCMAKGHQADQYVQSHILIPLKKIYKFALLEDPIDVTPNFAPIGWDVSSLIGVDFILGVTQL